MTAPRYFHLGVVEITRANPVSGGLKVNLEIAIQKPDRFSVLFLVAKNNSLAGGCTVMLLVVENNS
jgi:hypothetical protein